jgi:hypothetical protein
MKAYCIVTVSEAFSVVECEAGLKDKWLPEGFATEQAAREWITERVLRDEAGDGNVIHLHAAKRRRDLLDAPH